MRAAAYEIKRKHTWLVYWYVSLRLALSFYQHCMYDWSDQVFQPMRCRWQGSLLALGKEMFKELPNASSIWVDLTFSWERKGKKEISPIWPPWVQRHRSAQEPLSWPAPGFQSFQSAPTSGRLSDPAKHFKRYIRNLIVSFTLSGIWCFIPHAFTLP